MVSAKLGARSFDALIVGSGIIGASVGRALTNLGYRTINVDFQVQPGAGMTSYSSGIIRMFYSTDAMTKIAYEGYHRWQNWYDWLGVVDPNGMAKMIQGGSLELRSSQSWGFLEKATLNHKNNGIEFEDFDLKDLKSNYPWINPADFGKLKRCDHEDFGIPIGELQGGVFFPIGYVSDTQRATANIVYSAQEKGAQFLWRTSVVDVLRVPNGPVTGVKLSDGSTISTPIVVNCAGVYNRQLNDLVLKDHEDDMQIKTRALLREVGYIPKPSNWKCHRGTSELIIGDMNLGYYSRSEIGDKILVGSREPECDVPYFEYLDDNPDEVYNRSLGDEYEHHIMRIGTRISSIRVPNAATGIVALYDVTPDWVPIYDKTLVPGYFMAIGTSGNQFKCGPIVGDLMAGLIKYCTDEGKDHDTYPYEFHLSTIDAHVSTGSYSRLREPDSSTSRSVAG